MVDISYWCKKVPPKIKKNDTVFKAVQIIAEKGCDAIVVVENEIPLGIFTEQDLLRKVVAKEKNVLATKIEEVMTSPIDFLFKKENYGTALEKMKEKGYRHLPVVDEEKKLIGLLTLQDLVKF